MGRRKKVDSENIRNEKIKAVNNLKNTAGENFMYVVDVAMLSERPQPPPTFHDTTHQQPSRNCQLRNRLMVLLSILDSVTVVEQEWPRSAILAVQKRFERIPRNGWPATMRQEENEERRRIATCLTDPCTLTDTTEYINLKYKFLSKIKEISENEIGKEVVRTRKLPSSWVSVNFWTLLIELSVSMLIHMCR
ncbi:hypothetical protein CWI36_0522p0010 [Hamiltosporidium magnivora]|uniref:Uncharacterized protein n=1 Tax=Hamiltosporidium magnivora TaxID=148818 RepID=A0A4Q9LDK3_9MICR|nr:hypothetical protein CWI36_0522p0010 [Hamiltosporidium magnivora]